MAVQDDRREREMCQWIGLRAGEGRADVDAFLDIRLERASISVPIELKSTTNYSVSTARDVGPFHIEKWRSRVWIFGFYNESGSHLQKLLTLGPTEMEGWISKIERYIAPDFAIGERIAQKLDFADLYIICGEKSIYSLEDAMALHKRQWNRQKYVQEMDTGYGYTPTKMLEILKLRAVYLSHRGSTLNNPHIPASFFSQFEADLLDVANGERGRIALVTRNRIQEIALAHEILQRST